MTCRTVVPTAFIDRRSDQRVWFIVLKRSMTNRLSPSVIFTIFALVVFHAVDLTADDWPAFCGPRGDGKSNEKNAPTSWAPNTNIKWKVALASDGNSSPIVSNGRIFLHVASGKGRKRGLVCYDRTNGREFWSRTVEYAKVDQTHKTNPYDASTPVTDGKRVVVWHGSAGLYCYDFDGNELWSRQLGEIDHFLGYASSPIIYDGKVILSFGPGVNQAMLAVDLESGKTVWKTDEPGGNAGQKPREVASYSTPVVVRVDGKDQILNSMPTRVVAYEPADGSILWTVGGIPGRQDLVYTSPIIAGDLGIAMGGFRGPRLGFRLGGAGDVTKTHRQWHITGRNPQRIGTGVFVDGHVYTANVGPGTMECMDPRTGEINWHTRTPGGDVWASIIYAAGHLYITTQGGTTHVVRPNSEKLEIISSNALGETTNATPALSDGEFFIRTHEHLFCISD